MTPRPDPQPVASPRKQAIRELFDGLAGARDGWVRRNAAFYADDRRYMRFLIPPGSDVLEIGCGTGELLAALQPARGVGLDISGRMVALAAGNYPHLRFLQGDIEDPATVDKLDGRFDFIVLSDTIGLLDDVQAVLEMLHRVCSRETRVVVAYYSKLWEPALKRVVCASSTLKRVKARRSVSFPALAGGAEGGAAGGSLGGGVASEF